MHFVVWVLGMIINIIDLLSAVRGLYVYTYNLHSYNDGNAILTFTSDQLTSVRLSNVQMTR